MQVLLQSPPKRSHRVLTEITVMHARKTRFVLIRVVRVRCFQPVKLMIIGTFISFLLVTTLLLNIIFMLVGSQVPTNITYQPITYYLSREQTALPTCDSTVFRVFLIFVGSVAYQVVQRHRSLDYSLLPYLPTQVLAFFLPSRQVLVIPSYLIGIPTRYIDTQLIFFCFILLQLLPGLNFDSFTQLCRNIIAPMLVDISTNRVQFPDICFNNCSQ